jgi:hypothetical protein
MTTNSNQKQEHQYYINWLSILLIIIESLFHFGIVFTWCRYVKNETVSGRVLIPVGEEANNSFSEMKYKTL